MEPLIDVATLLERLDEPGLRILDARFELLDPPAGRRMYAHGHLPGAIYVDLDEDLAAPAARHGGRHPLPDMHALADKLGARGVGDAHEVVVYDQGGTFFAARAWWLLRYAGHARVRVLDGGFAAYLEAGGPVTDEAPKHPAATLTLRTRPDMVVDRHALLDLLGEPGACVLDVRAPERYRGDTEPIDPVAGHIPSAVNLPYQATLTPDGRFAPPSELRRQFRPVEGKAPVVSYCGSGVSAAHAVLAMEVAGIEGTRLYPGSWSDWCSYPELPVATGAAPGSVRGEGPER